ncbi:MAG TPA: DinB family protein [Chitinophagaceae bacterium]|jgi:uncharacterized damage-inducible protein DinB|nr:DinB family protein [Chitinophagaceae bacterium]
MKEILQQLSAYNIWANQLLGNRITSLDTELQLKEVKSSFNSLHNTILHLWDAENIWWQRMKLQERITRPSEIFSGTTTEAISELLQQNKQWNEWISAAQEHQLLHVFQYQNMQREMFKQPLYQMLVHLFHHGSYTRGQLVNIMRQLEVDKIPSTDFIIWSRKPGKSSS